MERNTAERLAALRREHGYSQEELAEKLGVSRQAVSKWERAESSPDTDNLVALARLYGTSLDSLVGIETPSAGAQDSGDEAADHDPASTPSRKTKIIIAVLIVLALIEAAGLAALAMRTQTTTWTHEVIGDVIATSQAGDEFVVQTNSDGRYPTGIYCYFSCKTTDSTRFFDLGDNELKPTWIREGWRVRLMLTSDSPDEVPGCAEVQEVHIVERDLDTDLELKGESS